MLLKWYLPFVLASSPTLGVDPQASFEFHDVIGKTWQHCKVTDNECCVPVDLIVSPTRRIPFFAEYASIGGGAQWIRGGSLNVYEYPQMACRGDHVEVLYQDDMQPVRYTRHYEDEGISGISLEFMSPQPLRIVYPPACDLVEFWPL